MAEEKRTEFAMKAMGLAELFQMSFGKERLVVGTKPRVQGALQTNEATYRMEISAPEGPSTGGGKQAVQHIKLIPDQGPTVVIGSVNQVEKTAELRSFAHLAQVHAQRFKGAKIPLMEERYNEVLRRLQAFFSNMGFRLIAAEPPRLSESARRGTSSSVIAGIVVALAAIAGALYFLLSHRAPG